MAGIENLINYGQAQILPKGASLNAFVDQLTDRKIEKEKYQDQKDRYAKEDRDRKENELYRIIGDEFNPRNFNALVHDKLRQKKNELVSKLRSNPNLSYGDVYLEAGQVAGELGVLSNELNMADDQIAKTKAEYERYDKGLKTSAIEFNARKKIVDDLRAGRRIDNNINHFDEALNNMPSGSLNYEGAAPINTVPEEFTDLKGGFKRRNKIGVVEEMNWSTKVLSSVYDYQDNGDDPPVITTKTKPSGIKDANGNDLPMLTESAYGRWAILPSKKRELYERAVNGKYPFRSKEAEILMRVEAAKEAEVNKPPVNSVPVERQPTPHYSSTTNVNTATASNYDDVYQEISDIADTKSDKKVPLVDLSTEAQTAVINQAKNLGYKDITQADIWVEKNSNGDLGLFKITDDVDNNSKRLRRGNSIGRLTRKGVNTEANQAYGQKPKQNALSNSGGAAKPTGKTESYTRAELKGKGWTDALIDKAVKEGKIKLK